MDKGTLIINIGDAEWKIFDVEYSIHYSSGGYGMPDRESKLYKWLGKNPSE